MKGIDSPGAGKLEATADFQSNLEVRKARGTRRLALFMGATIFAVVSLVTLVASIVNDAFGYVLLVDTVKPESLARDGSRSMT
jgi:hypothetical protein